MAFATLAELPVLGGTICLPRAGVWHADLEVDADAASTGAVTLVAGSMTLRGTAFRTGVFTARAGVRVVGGAASLGKTAPAKAYRGVPVSIVARDIVGDVGEALAASSDASLLTSELPAWVRLQQKASEQLGHLVDHFGVGWRVLVDGSVWLGTDTWPAGDLGTGALLREWPEQARAEYAVDDFTLLPATTLGGRQVDYVEHSVTPDGLRTRVWYVE